MSTLLESAQEFTTFCNHLIEGESVEHHNRALIPMTLLTLSLDHNRAIVELISLGHHSSAFALLRPQRDAFLRGIWLFRCATDSQISSFKSGKDEPPGIKTLLEGIEQTDGYRHGQLSIHMKDIKNILNDLTHGGLFQAASLDKGNLIENKQSEKNIDWLLRQTIMLLNLATLEMCHIFNNRTKSSQLSHFSKKIFKSNNHHT